MRRAAKIDDNQKEIVEALRKAGRSVQLLHTVGEGCPDLLVGFQGINYLIEIKWDKKARLTPKQIEFHSRWRGQRAIVTTIDEAILFTAGKRGEKAAA